MSTIQRYLKQRSQRHWAYLLVPLSVLFAGCYGDPPMPDQSQFKPLAELKHNGEAIVRLYGCPLPLAGDMGVHTWLVVKRADSARFDRWEGWVTAKPPLGYIWKNRVGLTDDLGAGGTYVIAELIGPEAELIIDFIENETMNYPCKDFYRFIPGPNSNTYIQWIVEKTGWDAELPLAAIGRDVPPVCP